VVRRNQGIKLCLVFLLVCVYRISNSYRLLDFFGGAWRVCVCLLMRRDKIRRRKSRVFIIRITNSSHNDAQMNKILSTCLTFVLSLERAFRRIYYTHSLSFLLFIYSRTSGVFTNEINSFHETWINLLPIYKGGGCREFTSLILVFERFLFFQTLH